jgi:Large eukaryotic DNA virus major capsid protein/Major capsid protein N-terminus
MAGRQVLAQLGRADIILSGEPEITFFLELYKAQGMFASRVIQVPFEHPPTYNSDQSVAIPLNGDLMTAMYARFDIQTQSGTAMFDSAGAGMIQRAELYIGNQLIERLWGEYIVLVNEIEVPGGQQPGLANLVGGTALRGANAPLSRYTVKLPFTCLRKGLPVVPGMFFRIILNDVPAFCATAPSSVQSMVFQFLVEYIFLSDPEREFIKNRGPALYLSENVQRARYVVPAGTSNVRCVTEFLHPVKELFFTIQRIPTEGFDYTLDSASNLDQLSSLTIWFNEVTRLEPEIGTALFLGTAQFMENHTRVPTRPFYMYSFSLDPEAYEPSGAVNFGRLKHQYFDLALVPQTVQTDRIVTIWARYYQMIEVNGLLGTMRVLFDNMSETGTIASLQ